MRKIILKCLCVGVLINLAAANAWDVNFIFEDRACPYEIVYQGQKGVVLAQFINLTSNYDSQKKKWGVRCFYKDKKVLD